MTILTKSLQWLAGVLLRWIMELKKLNQATSGPKQLDQIIGASPTADKDAVVYKVDELTGTGSWKPQQIDALNLPIDGGTW